MRGDRSGRGMGVDGSGSGSGWVREWDRGGSILCNQFDEIFSGQEKVESVLQVAVRYPKTQPTKESSAVVAWTNSLFRDPGQEKGDIQNAENCCHNLTSNLPVSVCVPA